MLTCRVVCQKCFVYVLSAIWHAVLMVGREADVAGTYVESVLSVFGHWFGESCPSAERAFHLVATRGLNKSVATLPVSYWSWPISCCPWLKYRLEWPVKLLSVGKMESRERLLSHMWYGRQMVRRFEHNCRVFLKSEGAWVSILASCGGLQWSILASFGGLK